MCELLAILIYLRRRNKSLAGFRKFNLSAVFIAALEVVDGGYNASDSIPQSGKCRTPALNKKSQVKGIKMVRMLVHCRSDNKAVASNLRRVTPSV